MSGRFQYKAEEPAQEHTPSASSVTRTRDTSSLNSTTDRPPIRVRTGKLFSYFSTKTYVVGTQKNRLNETVLLSTQNTCLSPPVKYFTDRSKAVLLLWIFYVFSVLCLLFLCPCLFICAFWSPAGKGLTSWLSFVVSNCEFVTFPLVSWVRCGT